MPSTPHTGRWIFTTLLLAFVGFITSLMHGAFLAVVLLATIGTAAAWLSMMSLQFTMPTHTQKQQLRLLHAVADHSYRSTLVLRLLCICIAAFAAWVTKQVGLAAGVPLLFIVAVVAYLGATQYLQYYAHAQTARRFGKTLSPTA